MPELIKIFEQNISARSQSYTAWSLGGTRSAKAISTLLAGTTNTFWATRTRCSAITALAKIHAEPELVVPALAKSLKDPDRDVRVSTISSLELFGSDAKPAVPALIQSLNDQDRLVRKHAQLALAKLDPEAAAKLGLRTNELHLGREGWEFVK